MRIRKHAKVSPLTYAASSLKPGALLHAHICHLNQSPWDVITFPPEEQEEGSSSMLLSPPPPAPPPPPPPDSFLFDGCESYPPNGSFNDSNEGVQSPDSAMLSPGWDYSNLIAAAPAGYSAAEEGAEEASILCCKTDGKAWQCKREAKDGHTFCDHHLEQLKHYNNLAHPTRTAVKKSEKQTPPAPADDSAPMTTRCRRPRPKKPSVSTNPYELYYYTGFGPLWGKKRGPGRASCTTSSAASEHDRGNGASSSASEMDDGEFDYVEDEYEDDEEDEFDDSKRKKARKPIKARSLKSLM